MSYQKVEEWHHTSLAKHKELHVVISVTKAMLTIFWDMNGTVVFVQHNNACLYTSQVIAATISPLTPASPTRSYSEQLSLSGLLKGTFTGIHFHINKEVQCAVKNW
jgi:hypothetical protein